MAAPVDVEAAREHIAGLLRALGHGDSSDPELLGTPERVATLLSARFGPPTEPVQLGRIATAPGERGAVYLRGLPFYAFCAHHMVPFFGHIDIAYLPDHSIAGFGAFGRLVEGLSRGPQLQERLAAQLADAIASQLEARAVVVHVVARQMCMELTGHACGAQTGVVAARGLWADAPWPVLAALRA